MFGFLIAAAAGFATPMLEGPAARPVARMLGQSIEIEDTEIRLIAFIIAMVIAAVVASIFDSGSMLGLLIGGALGYFGTRLFGALKRVIEGRKA